jgi:MFS family permease
MKELDMAHVSIGSFMAITLAAYALFNLGGDFLSDRLDTKRVMIIGNSDCLRVGYFLRVNVKLPTRTTLSFVLGNRNGTCLEFRNQVTFVLFSSKERMTAMGVFIASVGVADMIAKFAPPLLVSVYGWRLIFCSIAVSARVD